jgi:hypothetical protein
MDGIVTKAKQWLAHNAKEAVANTEAHEHIVESLVAEIKRIEAVNIDLAEQVYRLRTEGVEDIRKAAAEECAVICETTEYLVRSYGCAKEIRKHFGLIK